MNRERTARSAGPVGARRGALLFLACLLLSFAAYSTSLGGDFVYDDIPIVVQSDCHRGLSRIPRLFDPTDTTICSLRPMRYLSYTLDHALWGDRPVGYHLTNVVIHAAVGWLALLLLLQLGLRRETAMLAAGFFLLHPIATEAVAYISGRRDLLMALFCLLCAHVYLAYQRRGGWHRIVLMGAALVAAIWSHETAAVLPAALAALELCRGAGAPPGARRVTLREALAAGLRRLLERRVTLPLSLLLVIGLGFTFWIVTARNFSDRHQLWGPDLAAHVATVLRVHAHYIRQLVWPDPLIADYSPEAFRVSRSLLEPGALGALALVLGLVTAALLLLRRWPLMAAAVLVYFTLLLPASQIVVHHELLAEHRLYLPSLCFAALLGGSMATLVQRFGRPSWGLVVALALSYLALTNARNLDWRDSLTLWSVTVKQVPRCARAHANLGAALAERHSFGAARAQLETALRIRPELCEAQKNLGQLLLDTGHPRRGLKQLRRAAHCSPKPSYLRTLGFAALGQGRYRLGAAAFRKALSMAPDDADLRFGLGAVLQRSGDAAGAMTQFRRAERLRPRWPKLLYRMAQVQAELCDLVGAERTARRFLQIWRRDSVEAGRLRDLLRSRRGQCADQR